PRTVRAPSAAATDAADSDPWRASIPLRSLAIRESWRLTFASSFLHVNWFISGAARAFNTAPPTSPLSITRHVYAAFSRIYDPMKSSVFLVDSWPRLAVAQ